MHPRHNGSTKWYWPALFLVLLLAGMGGCTYSLRQYAIRDCHDKGGMSVAPPWWANDPADVRCILPGDVP